MSPNFPWEWRCSCWAALNCFLKDWVLDSLPFLAAVEDCSSTYSCRLQRFHERVRKTHCDKIFGQRNLLLSDSIWRLINVFQNSHPFKSSTIWWLDRHKFTTYHLLMAALMRDCSVCLSCSSSGRVIRPWCLSSVRHRPSEMRQQSLYPFIVEPVPDAYLPSESSVPDAYPLTESSVPDAYPLSKSSVPDAYPLTESSVWVTHLLSGPLMRGCSVFIMMLILWQSHPSLMLILCQTSTEWDARQQSLCPFHRCVRVADQANSYDHSRGSHHLPALLPRSLRPALEVVFDEQNYKE